MKTLLNIVFIFLAANILAQEIPSEATHIPAATQITWKWHPVTGATGYKWNTSTNYASATDLATDTLNIETGLESNTAFTRYVWAYNACGHSSYTILTETTSDDFICGTSKTINHLIGVVSPVTKTVTYGTVSGISGEPDKCWITRNLGASNQASAYNDNTEASAGWYWQFNKKQGYKHDGVARTPATTWITSIIEYSTWMASNDPCFIELGYGWRIPTQIEWVNVDSENGWGTYNGPWTSALKLHAAGYLYSSTGLIKNRGSEGFYWSNTQSSEELGWKLGFGSGYCSPSASNKTFGNSLRCLKDNTYEIPDLTIPTVTTTEISDINYTTATGGGDVISDGGSTIIARGICWGLLPSPDLTDNFSVDSGDPFTSYLIGLESNTLYYVRAYSTNSEGTAYGNQVSFTTLEEELLVCEDFKTVYHKAGTVAPVKKMVVYEIISGISKCWITSNLGADRQAKSKNDDSEASAGWYWQFNNKQGYEHTGVNRTPVNGWKVSIIENSNWVGGNDPCTIELGSDWRIPTLTEWTTLDAAGNWGSLTDSYQSDLKLHAAGRLNATGNRQYVGNRGYYWSSNQSSTTNGYRLGLTSTTSDLGGSLKTFGLSIRCLQDL